MGSWYPICITIYLNQFNCWKRLVLGCCTDFNSDLPSKTSLQVCRGLQGPTTGVFFCLCFPKAPSPTSLTAIIHHHGAWVPVVGEKTLNRQQVVGQFSAQPPTHTAGEGWIEGVAVVYECKMLKILILYFASAGLSMGACCYHCNHASFLGSIFPLNASLLHIDIPFSIQYNWNTKHVLLLCWILNLVIAWELS